MHKKAEAQLNGAAAKCEITCASFKEGGKKLMRLFNRLREHILYILYVYEWYGLTPQTQFQFAVIPTENKQIP
jgi:hypothetical protein